ncbi:free fatty acid receptor 4 [Microplitis demolitor]|uniref:free fatty acid receptor 4 n=1 Tax=Microplitis demolitor TaxID=69319 RepID=UPI00043FFF22|nr:free fatty acid receptor 4 [Microplitis demolitor]
MDNDVNSSYLFGHDKTWGEREFFTYYSEFGDRNGSSAVEVIILAITFVVAVIANFGIAVCVLSYKEMRTPTNLCLVNLAAADLLFALGVPAVAYTRLTQSWRLGDIVCRLLPYSQFVCGFVLLWTLTLISMDRHRCLAVAPYRSALTTTRVLVASLMTWFIGSLIFLPVVFWFQIKLIDDLTICTLIFPINEIINVSLCFTIPIIIIACLLPMCLLVYHYQRIFQKIIDTRSRWAVSCVTQAQDPTRRDSELSVVGTLVPWAGRKSSAASVSSRQGRAGSLSQHEEIRLHKHLRVVRILLLNVFAVLLMWLPITIIMLLIYLDGRRPPANTNDYFLRSHHFIWTLIIAQFNTVINPLLYGVLSENFRSCFVKMCRRNNTSGSERPSGGCVTGGNYPCAKPNSKSRKNSKSLEIIQNRLRTRRNNSFKNISKVQSKKSSSSIGSIIEVPAEKI